MSQHHDLLRHPNHILLCPVDCGICEEGEAIMSETATSIRYREAIGGLAQRRLLQYPDCQAEAIAKHYAAHAVMALELLKLIEQRKISKPSPNIEWVIAHLVSEIKNNHWHDFGIELEWRNP